MSVTIDRVRSVEWSRGYLWDVKFPDAPVPFNEWFPAVDVELNLATLNSYEFEGGGSTYKIPFSSSAFDLKVTYVDDIHETLTNWIEKWINEEILCGDNTIIPVKRAVRMVQVMALDLNHEPLHVHSLWVYPEGGIYFHGTSESETHIHTVSFVIVGKGGGH